jgi:hypothetical protein
VVEVQEVVEEVVELVPGCHLWQALEGAVEWLVVVVALVVVERTLYFCRNLRRNIECLYLPVAVEQVEAAWNPPLPCHLRTRLFHSWLVEKAEEAEAHCPDSLLFQLRRCFPEEGAAEVAEQCLDDLTPWTILRPSEQLEQLGDRKYCLACGCLEVDLVDHRTVVVVRSDRREAKVV